MDEATAAAFMASCSPPIVPIDPTTVLRRNAGESLDALTEYVPI